MRSLLLGGSSGLLDDVLLKALLDPFLSLGGIGSILGRETISKQEEKWVLDKMDFEMMGLATIEAQERGDELEIRTPRPQRP